MRAAAEGSFLSLPPGSFYAGSSPFGEAKSSPWGTCDRAGAPNAFYEVGAKK